MENKQTSITTFYDDLLPVYVEFVKENVLIQEELDKTDIRELNDFIYNFCDNYFEKDSVDFIVSKIWTENDNVLTRVLLHDNGVSYTFVFSLFE